MESRHLLSKLTPLKPILCIVATTARSDAGRRKMFIGTALSDPYLGHASHLLTAMTTDEVEEIIEEQKPGALVFGLPMIRTKARQNIPSQYLEHREKIFEHTWSVPLKCKIDERLTLDEAVSRKETEWEMWEDIDPVDGEPSTDAAVALNAWLWKYCGGWRNTFG